MIRIPAGAGSVPEASLTLPAQPVGAVLFAHGSGSSRFSPRNRFVAKALQQVGLGTLLMDLFSGDSCGTRDNGWRPARIVRAPPAA